MAKRIATSELTDRNWDQEEEEEEAGEFVAAKKEVLKQRNIIKAKRRSTTSTTSSGSGLFASFAGFTSPSLNSSSNSSSVVKGGSDLSSSFIITTTTTAGTTTTTTATATVTTATTLSNSTIKPFGDSSSNFLSNPTTATVSFGSGSITSKNGFMTSAAGAGAAPTVKSTDSDSKLHVQLKKLNESVLKWLQQHVTKDPYCILTPIFKDYEKYLKTIQDESHARAEDSKDEAGNTVTSPPQQKSSSLSTFESLKDDNGTKAEVKNPGGWPKFSANNSIFSSSSATITTSVTSTSVSTTPAFSGFNFKAADSQSSSFSFATSLTASNAAKGRATEEEDEYVPPKAEVKEIKEEGSVFSKRCKLFYEKDKNWVDKGIGNLHVKPFKDKAQLIIRADTNLGNILLNVMLLPSMQLMRQGKNNVSFVCIPNPPLMKDTENKLVPLLLRVKTSEEADELLAKLNTYKQGTDHEEVV